MNLLAEHASDPEQARNVLVASAQREVVDELASLIGRKMAIGFHTLALCGFLGVQIGELLTTEKGEARLINPEQLFAPDRAINYDGLASYMGLRAVKSITCEIIDRIDNPHVYTREIDPEIDKDTGERVSAALTADILESGRGLDWLAYIQVEQALAELRLSGHPDLIPRLANLYTSVLSLVGPDPRSDYQLSF